MPGADDKPLITTVDLLRHGEPVGGAGRCRGHVDDPLSEQGWQQMWAAVENAPGWDLVVSSPLARCQEFARQLAASRGIPCESWNDLREFFFGDWEGRDWQQLMQDSPQAVQAFWRDPVANPPPGGESLAAFAGRVRRCHHSLRRRHAGRHILYVVHGGVIRILLQEVLQLPDQRLLALEVPWACLSRLRYENVDSLEAALLFHDGRP